MSKFCPDLLCDFYDSFPDGNKKIKTQVCFLCQKPFIDYKPETQPDVVEPDASFDTQGIIVNNNAMNFPTPTSQPVSITVTENVIVVFHTAILLTHFKATSSISLRFKHQFPKELNINIINLKEFERRDYRGDTYILLENSIRIPIAILDNSGRKSTLIMSYKYFLNDQEENFYFQKGVTHRTLLLNYFKFQLPNVINQYDMIITPENLPAHQQRDFKTLWRVTFHLYSPVTEIFHDNKLILKFSEIKSQVADIIFSLCYAYMICKSTKYILLTKVKYSNLYDSEEEVLSFMRDLLLEWIDSIVDSNFPFHLKFYLSFLTVDRDMMLPCSGQIYFKLFKDINTDFILSIMKNDSEQKMLFEYQQDIQKSPQLLHRAIQDVSSIDIENLITFLPLYHLLFNSEHSFSEAHNKHDFLNNSYWGLPPDIPFTNTDIELPIIVNTLSQYNRLGPILPYSVTLLCLRLEIFPQLLDILAIPFLSFIAVLLYRTYKWDSIARDEQLRVTVFRTFLDKSEQNPNLMNERHLYQAADVIFSIIHVLEDSHKLSNPLFICFNEANLLLQVLARLMCLSNRDKQLSSEQRILSFIPSSDLLASLTRCVDESKMNDKPNCGDNCLRELTIWNRLLCIQFPSSYQWVDSVTKTFSKRLSCHYLSCLLDLFTQICTICTETEVSSVLFEIFRAELTNKLLFSESQMKDEQLVIQSLEKVPVNQFPKVIDVFAKIISLHGPGITGTDAVRHILSLSWLPSVLKHCQPSMLKSSSYPQAADLLYQCVNILHNITSEFQLLTIQVNHLKTVLESKSLYFSILQVMCDVIPDRASKLLDEDVFEKAIEFRKNLLSFFLHQCKLIKDLENLLDSTNSLVYAKEVLTFFDISYDIKPISHICSALKNGEFTLESDIPCLYIFNNSLIRTMLESLPHLLKSQFFQIQFKQNLNIYLEEIYPNKAIDVATVHSRIFVPTFEYVSQTISDLFSLSIHISTINEHFARYINCPELMNVEIDHIITAMGRMSAESYKPILDETIRKVGCYFNFQKSQKVVFQILKVKTSYHFDGKFAQTEFISSLKTLDGAKELKIVTPQLIKMTDSVVNLDLVHVNILKTLMGCVSLFTWTAGILKKPSDLDDFTNLALNCVDNTAAQINRITCFKSVCTIFSPFIFQLQDIDEVQFLQRLQEVYNKIHNRDELADYLLKTSLDCARESEITFWKEIQFTHTSIGGKTISQLKQIMQYGRFVLTTSMDTRTVDDVLKLYVTSDQLTNTDSVYNLDELRDIQSNIVLITPLMHEDKDSARFLAHLQDITALAELVQKLHSSGHVFFANRTLEYKCQNVGSAKEDIHFLKREFREWEEEISQARKGNYYLNYFTDSQILTIRISLEGIYKQRDLNRDTIHLLTLIRPDLSQTDIETALSRVRRGSLSYSSLTDSINSFPESAGDMGSFTSGLSSCPIDSSYEPFSPIQYGVQQVSIRDLFTKMNKYNVTLSDVGLFLDNISSHDAKRIDRSFPKYFEPTNPNLIVSPYSDIIYTILSLYFHSDSKSELPSPHEVLICTSETTSEEIDIFWRRCILSPSDCDLFCLAFIENLKYEVAVHSVSSLKNLIRYTRSFHLVLLCSSECEQSSYMATALVKFKRAPPHLIPDSDLKEFIFRRISNIPNSPVICQYLPLKSSPREIDPDKSCVRIVSSDRVGSGKSLTVSRLVDKLMKLSNVPNKSDVCSVVPIYESECCEDRAATKLIHTRSIYPDGYGCLCHFDITATSCAHLIPFLFKLLITGMICDKNGRVWHCSKKNYFVLEITLSSQSPEFRRFQSLFPDWQCLGPNSVLDNLNKNNQALIGCQVTMIDQQEVESREYQRVYAYLSKLESKGKGRNLDEYKFHQNKSVVVVSSKIAKLILDLFVRYFSHPQPSWRELNHFISFLNNQLMACEHDDYSVRFSTKRDFHWKGFNNFLVDCMILMARDFTTPSLMDTLGLSPALIGSYGIEQRRKWEQKVHPYIFLNEDRQSMTFFGIHITEDTDQLDDRSTEERQLIGKKCIPKLLYSVLIHNKIEFDCYKWDRTKMIHILAKVMGIRSPPGPEFDPFYVLTIDNLKKMLAIHMRFRCNIPVIMMGETGCGKTRLIHFMCRIQANNLNIQNMVILKIHGETTKQDIISGYRNALKLAEENVAHHVDTVLFFDEANTSHTIGLIKEILCDRRIDGETIPTDLRLQFIAACNPYRKHSEAMISKLTSAGLGMLRNRSQTREQFGDIPLRDLVYRVIPLPRSLLPLVWDFGELNSEAEKCYIIEIIHVHINTDCYKGFDNYCDAIAAVLSCVQNYMREMKDECSFVSLRDVERTVQVMLWFYKLVPKLQLGTLGMSLITYSLILSIAVCYRAKLKDRAKFDSYLTSSLVVPLSTFTEPFVIKARIDQCQTRIVNLMKIEAQIARNSALTENLFMMFVCIQLKIPLFIVGKPGSSKSLARSIIHHSFNEGLCVEGRSITDHDHLYMQCYQCSQYTTSAEIVQVFSKSETIQQESTADSVACVVLDEVGLAEDSPNLPLKILHSLLEDYGSSEITQKWSNVSFIGLSNWALDPAKMNRGIMLQLEDPTPEELVKTAHAIIDHPSDPENEIHSTKLTPYLKSLAGGYLVMCSKQNFCEKDDYFGLRDFYCLIKMLYNLCRHYKTDLNRRILIHAVKRNFGGIPDIDVEEVFGNILTVLDDTKTGPLSDPLSLIRISINSESSKDSTFEARRYLLLLTENHVAVDYLFQSRILDENTKMLFGSSFPFDKESFNICHNINRIKIYMETGETVVLTNLTNLYDSLYEVLNQFYVNLLGKNWVTVGIGSQRVECPVDPKFRLIVIADKATVFKEFPPPLINRLEKHTLNISTILPSEPVVQGVVEKLYNWLNRFCTIEFEGRTHSYSENECFVGLQQDTTSLIVYSYISKLGFNRIDEENEDAILEQCKLDLLKLTSPDAILRLSKSLLGSEVEIVSKKYFALKLFSLSEYLQQLSCNAVTVQSDAIPKLSFVTTHSSLLTETDITELSDNLEACFDQEDHFHITNLCLSQYQTEKEFISSIHNLLTSVSLATDERSFILIQCEDGYSNHDLISCAKFKMMEVLNELKSELNPNFHIIFIVRLLSTKQNSSFSGYCGIAWDSVHIDELRQSHHSLLPNLNLIPNLTVADIFDYKLSVESSRQKRLLRSVQSAVSRLVDPSNSTNYRRPKRVERLSMILTNPTYSDIADILCDKISWLLRQITLTEYSKDWSLQSSLRDGSQATYPTVIESLSHSIDVVIEPILRRILGVMDSYQNLDLLFSKTNQIRHFWKILFRDDSLLELRALIEPTCLRSQESYLSQSPSISVFSCRFPFFFQVYKQVNQIYDELMKNMGKKESWKCVEDIFNDTPTGQAIKSNTTENYPVPLSLKYVYLCDFVHLQMSQPNEDIFKVLYVMLAVASSDYLCELQKEEFVISQNDSPNISIPFLHIAREEINQRIYFVKEAISGGFYFPKDHLICLDNSLSNPKTYSTLKHLDFDLFESIIQRCWENVVKYLKNPESFKYIDTVKRTRYLIVENMFLFQKDFSEELIHLRCRWHAVEMVIIFATNLTDNRFRGLLDSQSLMKHSLDTLTQIVSPENVDFFSTETYDAILKLLNDMNSQAWNIYNEGTSIGLSPLPIDMQLQLFQSYATRVLQQFLSKIIFSSTSEIPDTLMHKLIELFGTKRDDKYQIITNDVTLFERNQIHPSLALRSILLGYILSSGYGRIIKPLNQLMEDVYRAIQINKSTHRDDIAIVVLQSLENSHHLPMNEHLTLDEKFRFIKNLLGLVNYHKTTDISEVLESVAIIKTGCTTPVIRVNTMYDSCLRQFKKIGGDTDSRKNILSFFLKTLYFHSGYGDLVSYFRRDWWLNCFDKDFDSLKQNIYLDLFYGFDSKYEEVMNSHANLTRITNLQKQFDARKFNQSVVFVIFTLSCTHYMKGDAPKLKLASTLTRANQNVGNTIQRLSQFLPTELQNLAHGMLENRFINMTQFSENTHLNKVLISGLLLHIAVFLHHSEDNKFLKPLTSIHYTPTELADAYLPSIEPLTATNELQVPLSTPSTSLPVSTGIPIPHQNIDRFSTLRIHERSRPKRMLHTLGDPLLRSDILPTGLRNISAISVALLRVIIHSIFVYTLQTRNMMSPTDITELVECTEPYSCTNYFSLHLIQDIRDVTAICNKTFEEAILIVHVLIDHLITVRADTQVQTRSVLETEIDLTRWEKAFERTHIYKLDVLKDSVLREKMLTVIDKSKECDTSLLSAFYEKEESSFGCKLWRHRNIIGYDHLLQVFGSMSLCESSQHPFLRKFLREQPLLSCTKYLPDFISLHMKLVQRSSHLYKNTKVLDMCISDFLHFVTQEINNSYADYATQFTNLTITCSQLIEEKHKLNTYYPFKCSLPLITQTNTRIGELLSTAHQRGILSSLINTLVVIHNSFVAEYTQLFSESEKRGRVIPLSLFTSHRLINYTDQLANVIVSNANCFFRMGEGRLIEYNFVCIERDLCDSFMVNKPFIENDLDIELTELRLFNHLKTIQVNVPQEDVSEDIWNSIKEVLDQSADISDTVSLIELVISFVSFGKQRPQQTIKSYMHEVLKYPSSKPLINPITDEVCNLTHLLSLWEKLSMFRTKLLPIYCKFSHVSKCYTAGLDYSQSQALKNGITSKNIQEILSILYTFIIFKLNGQNELTALPPPHQRLQEYLRDFSKWKLSLPRGDPVVHETIPESILVCHTVSTWNELIGWSKLM